MISEPLMKMVDNDPSKLTELPASREVIRIRGTIARSWNTVLHQLDREII